MGLHIDFETRSTVDLRKTGVHKYAKDITTDVWCMAYKIDDGETKLWASGEPHPEEVLDYVEKGGLVYAHNAQFELAIWNHIMHPRYGWPELLVENTRCTMAMCHALALPASLEKAAGAVGLDISKDMSGRRLMLQMAKPRRTNDDGTIVWWDDDERKQRLFSYCKTDVDVEYGLEKRLLELSPSEQKVWALDQLINNRGVYIDLDSVHKAVDLVESEKKDMNKRVKKITKGGVTTANQVAKLKTWCEDNSGLKIETLNKNGIATLLEQELPEDVREVLEIRQAYAKASTAKLNAMIASACDDSRARGLFQYHGANTGRWAGRRIQLQNFPRGGLSMEEIDWVAQNFTNPDLIKLVHGNPMSVVSDCLRSMICASPGKDLICADFSAIEARVLAWLAGEEDVLQVFRDGKDIYLHEATGIYKRTITKEDKDERQIGKVATLALGYGGGVGAFQSMAAIYGIDVGDESAEEIKKAWRGARELTVRYWKDCEEAAKNAIRNKGQSFRAGAVGRNVIYKVLGSFLFCRLPSGRCLSYPFPGLREVGFYRDEEQKVRRCSVEKLDRYKDAGLDTWTNTAVTFRGTDINNQWGEMDTYGGKLVENITQAVARDLLSESMIRAEDAGYPVVLHVHDEVACEVKSGDLEEFEALLAETPKWAPELPMEAEGWKGRRYRK